MPTSFTPKYATQGTTFGTKYPPRSSAASAWDGADITWDSATGTWDEPSSGATTYTPKYT